MHILDTDELIHSTCKPCEGGIAPLGVEDARSQLASLCGWEPTHENSRIRRDWTAGSFRRAIAFLTDVARLAEEQGHHPDLHLVDYKHVWIELSTHAIGGLSENDFILAAKIDQLTDKLGD